MCVTRRMRPIRCVAGLLLLVGEAAGSSVRHASGLSGDAVPTELGSPLPLPALHFLGRSAKPGCCGKKHIEPTGVCQTESDCESTCQFGPSRCRPCKTKTIYAFYYCEAPTTPAPTPVPTPVPVQCPSGTSCKNRPSGLSTPSIFSRRSLATRKLAASTRLARASTKLRRSPIASSIICRAGQDLSRKPNLNSRHPKAVSFRGVLVFD